MRKKEGKKRWRELKIEKRGGQNDGGNQKLRKKMEKDKIEKKRGQIRWTGQKNKKK